MAKNLLSEDWFVTAVNPSEAEKNYINERYMEFIEKLNAKKSNSRETIILVAREMLGRT